MLIVSISLAYSVSFSQANRPPFDSDFRVRDGAPRARLGSDGDGACSALGTGEFAMASTRQLLRSAPAQGPGQSGFDYDDKGPLSFTITARNTSADSIAHQGGKDTSAEQCTISGATPTNLTKFDKGPLNVSVEVGKRSVIVLRPFPGTSYKDGVITGSTNVTAFAPSASAPQSVSFNPDYSKELSTVTIGVYNGMLGGQEARASCTLKIFFIAKKNNGANIAPVASSG